MPRARQEYLKKFFALCIGNGHETLSRAGSSQSYSRLLLDWYLLPSSRHCPYFPSLRLVPSSLLPFVFGYRDFYLL
eukprot:scaffold196328_cov33-Tisochrysis_lutea.AAC.1